MEKLNLKLQKKYKTIQQKEKRYESIFLPDAKIILVAYGTMARIAKALVNKLREKGEKIGLIRPITLWPFPDEIFRKITGRPSTCLPAGRDRQTGRRVKFLVVEMSYGQMLEDVKLAVDGKAKVEFLGRAGGGIPTEEEIIERVQSLKV